MRYEGNVIRPPSEAYSYILQVTLGCAHNKCTFCGTFKDKKFKIRSQKEVFEDLTMARTYYRHIDKIFLADGDALVLKNSQLMAILNKIKELFPECHRVGIYGRAQDILRKTEEELIELRNNGLGIIYMGVESGNPEILKRINKGETREEMIAAVKKAEATGIKTSVTFITGIGGRELWKKNAIDTGTIITKMEPTYASLLTLMVVPGTPLYDDVQTGKFELLKPEETLLEIELLLKNINVKKECIFRSNHASNYVSLRGTLPHDKDTMIKHIQYAQKHRSLWKNEEYRGL